MIERKKSDRKILEFELKFPLFSGKIKSMTSERNIGQYGINYAGNGYGYIFTLIFKDDTEIECNWIYNDCEDGQTIYLSINNYHVETVDEDEFSTEGYIGIKNEIKKLFKNLNIKYTKSSAQKLFYLINEFSGRSLIFRSWFHSKYFI